MFRAMRWAGVLALVSLLSIRGSGAEWQFSIPADKGGRVFLWIPPDCERVRGVIFGQQVILEKLALEDPQVRAAAAGAGLAMILTKPNVIGGDFGTGGASDAKLQETLGALAAVSGYDELASAPLLMIGHSGGAIPAWNFAYAHPERCIAVIGLKAAPISPPPGTQKSPKDGTACLNGVPVLDISGQYESWGLSGRSADYHWRWVRGSLLAFRAIGHNALMGELVEPGNGHFSWDEPLARYVSLFIGKVATARLPAEGSAGLRPMEQENGWLVDPTFLAPVRHASAPFKEYSGDPTLALWYPDGELALAAEKHGRRQSENNLQLVTFVQDGKRLESAWIQELKFEPAGDGVTVRVAADFVRETPPELSHPAKRTLGHAGGPIRFRLIGGWSGGGEQTGPDTFRIKADRFQLARPSGTLMVMAFHDGDGRFARHEQAAVIKYPEANMSGDAQQIAFETIPDQTSGSTVALKATSDSGLPVDFCVLEGPAEIEDGKLKITRIPPRSKYPVKVTVAATQWGRSIAPLVASAKPVLQTFSILPNP